MNSIIRLTAAVNKVNSGNPADCFEEVKQVITELPVQGSDLVIFPKLALCGAGCGSLFQNSALLDQCDIALDELRALTSDRDQYILVGVVADDNGRAVSCMALLYKGDLVALVPTLDNPPPFINEGYSENFMPADAVFACGSLRFSILGCNLSTLALQAARASANGCDLLIIPAYSPVRAGFMDEVLESAKTISSSAGCAIAVVNGGVGDTSSPYLYGGFAAIYECGRELARCSCDYESFSCTVDVDVDIINANKKINAYSQPLHMIEPAPGKPGILRHIRRDPFLPEKNRDGYLRELFSMQVRSLVARMSNISISHLVVGVSGGIDSTACLLVSAAAMDALGLPRSNITGVTMPGLGTSDRTYFNALSLLEGIGVTMRDISIRPAVLQHFSDIGHSGRPDTAYENIQARERTQILLDIANMTSGLVVGSGDLSEEALGFCTFGGDHLASYNVNSCITKTVLREMLRYIADNGVIADVNEILRDILDTPVSPELLPTASNGDIAQKTEDILGPYELHDFFLYYFIKYRFRPSKLFYYACFAFAGELEPAFIKDKLALFLKKLAAGQFKRACAPDSASITEVNLSNVNYQIPSDLDPSALLRDLDGIEV